MKTFIFTAAALICASASSAATYTDRATFLAQGGTYTDHTNIAADFTISSGGGGANAFLDSTTYTDKFSPNPYVVISGVENFNAVVTFASAIYAFGMDVYEPTSPSLFNGCNVTTCVESTFELSFLNGASLLETIIFSPANDILDFIGYSNASAFDRIEVRETVGTNDNEMFGNFVTSTTQLNAVPLPGGLPLLAAGLVGFGLMARRKRK
jgi:hypothetical protein